MNENIPHKVELDTLEISDKDRNNRDLESFRSGPRRQRKMLFIRIIS